MERTSRGFTLVEMLVALLAFMVVALAIVPLMMRGIANNIRGSEAQHLSRQVESRLETLLQLPFDGGEMVVPSGAMEASESEIWVHDRNLVTGDWTTGTIADHTGDGQVLWVRETRIQQYGIADFESDADGLVTLDDPISGGERPYSVHLKMVEGRVYGTRLAGPLGAGQQLTVRMLRAY